MSVQHQAADPAYVLESVRKAVLGSEFEGRLYLVGGYVRDRLMGQAGASADIDIVLEGDSGALANHLYRCGVAQHRPVFYPRFGTAMIVVAGRDVELVTARSESYAPDSRKPAAVRPGTLADDARRRDFTINTLLQNLETGAIVDPLGRARYDIAARIIRTPNDPVLTFSDDPLRMLRAVRFAVRFDFSIDSATWEGLISSADRLAIVSAERIRDEFSKILSSDHPSRGLDLLEKSGLLRQFAPELAAMVGVTQNAFHAFPVWEHTLAALDALPGDSPPALRLAVLLHDVGKPTTREVDVDGNVHFYRHEDVGADIARNLLQRLKFTGDATGTVVKLVAEHMRIGEYSTEWTDSAVRRLIRDLGDSLDDLFAVHAADVAALAPDNRDMSRARELRRRIAEIQSREDVRTLKSPLDGLEIMNLLGLTQGRIVGGIKDYLTNEVVEGRLNQTDKESAARLARQLFEKETIH